ncbi:uncharacterized protein LOC126834983 [Adelges cooleyi]|uniref:uncharacterized protein LOC126834983 n=1 Tax=Adelges cooleyi TaxID=133065 RepID=UPI00217FED91|nr:uncharacterized protein LOC126834983 [Adelges cooleyi]
MLLIHLICILCLVSKNSYEDINRELGKLCSVPLKSERALRLTLLMNDHWYLESYIKHMSNTFGPELLFIILEMYIQLVLAMYILIWTNILHNEHVTFYKWFFATLQLALVAGNFIYLCYRSSSIISESRQVISQLQHLRDKLYDDPKCQAILKIFTLRVNCRQVHVSVLKLFDINLPLVIVSAGYVLTYFLVLIQFQVEGYNRTLREMNISAIVIKNCKVWPCITDDD